MAVLPMKSLLEAGVHFGHRTRRWNPKMRPFIFTERNGIHIIDLQQTMGKLEEAYNFARETASQGGMILFVGTKRQAQETVQAEALRCGMPYVTQRWLGGTLTNFRTIRSRIDYMLKLEERQATGDLDKLIKKEALLLTREMTKLRGVYSAALWVAEQEFKKINHHVSDQIRSLRRDVASESGGKSRIVANLLGPILLWTKRREDRRVAAGKTYEPPTIIERTNWVLQ